MPLKRAGVRTGVPSAQIVKAAQASYAASSRRVPSQPHLRTPVPHLLLLQPEAIMSSQDLDAELAQLAAEASSSLHLLLGPAPAPSGRPAQRSTRCTMIVLTLLTAGVRG